MDELKVPRIWDDRHGRRAAEACNPCALAPTVRLLACAWPDRAPPLRQPALRQPFSPLAWDIRGKQPRRIAQVAVRETTDNQMPARPCLSTTAAWTGASVPEVHLLAQQAPQPITWRLSVLSDASRCQTGLLERCAQKPACGSGIPHSEQCVRFPDT